MINKGVSLILICLCIIFFLTAANTQITKLEPFNPNNNLVWKKIKSKIGNKMIVYNNISGEFTSKITGPSGEVFENIAAGDVIFFYDKNGVATFNVSTSTEGSGPIELVKVHISPNWQSRYNNGETVQVPEIEEIVFIAELSGNNAKLKVAGFTDPYNILVKYETKYDSEIAARRAKVREEEAAIERIRIKAEESRIREEREAAQLRLREEERLKSEKEKQEAESIKEAFNKPEKLASLEKKGWDKFLEYAKKVRGAESEYVTIHSGTTLPGASDHFTEFILDVNTGLYTGRIERRLDGRVYSRGSLVSRVPVPYRRFQYFILRNDSAEVENAYGEKVKSHFAYVVGVSGGNKTGRDWRVIETDFTYDPVEVKRLLEAVERYGQLTKSK